MTMDAAEKDRMCCPSCLQILAPDSLSNFKLTRISRDTMAYHRTCEWCGFHIRTTFPVGLRGDT